MDVIAEVSKVMNIPKRISQPEVCWHSQKRESGFSELDLADIRDRYNVATKEELYEKIKSKTIESHPAWEDYITWKNKEQYIADLKEKLKIIR